LGGAVDRFLGGCACVVTAHDAAGNAAFDVSNMDFTLRPYVVTASAGAGGSVAPYRSHGAAYGAT
jgi:hypothetical protein